MRRARWGVPFERCTRTEFGADFGHVLALMEQQDGCLLVGRFMDEMSRGTVAIAYTQMYNIRILAE